MQTIIVGTPGPRGPKGETGAPREKRSDYSGSFSYCGYADQGSLETADVWTITRITNNQNGTVETGTTSSADWTNRYTHNYT